MSNFITQFAHFDSANANYVVDPTNTTGWVLSPYKCQFPMTQTYKNIKRVYLKSIELPMGFSNVRKGSTDTFSFILNGTTYSAVLTEKNYATIAVLLTDLTSACFTAILGSGCTMNFALTGSGNTPNRIIINITGATTFQVIDTNFSTDILGFRAASDGLFSGVYAATSCNYNLNPDSYISIYIPSLNGSNASMSGQYSTFKLPLNSITNQVYYYQENGSFSQFVDITDKNLTVSSLTVVIFDKFGNNLSPNGLDYSMTLAFELWR